jgi:hypothetical protein
VKTLSSTIYLLVTLCLSLSLLTCKQTDVLPQATQEGKNTFGCLIDGKPYIPNGGGSFSGIKPIYGGFLVLSSKPYKLGIYVYTYEKSGQKIEIYLNDYLLGKHILNSNTSTIPASVDPQDYASYTSVLGDKYITSSKYTGQITIIKADTAIGIVSGTFDFEAVTSIGQTVTVTKGRFDVNARTQ